MVPFGRNPKRYEPPTLTEQGIFGGVHSIEESEHSLPQGPRMPCGAFYTTTCFHIADRCDRSSCGAPRNRRTRGEDDRCS